MTIFACQIMSGSGKQSRCQVMEMLLAIFGHC
uniref:Uncharacterized protein n=1 Tax=Anguilla anguilla TaxID=7936 RepID=A0A0E9UU33_ANGAN